MSDRRMRPADPAITFGGGAADIENVVVRYLGAVATGSATDIAALYASNATVEDPVGSEPHRGHDAIAQFYSALDGAQISTELLHLRVAGCNAAFHFRVATKAGGQTFIIEPIDVMTFDSDGLITSMRAFWSPEDMIAGP